MLLSNDNEEPDELANSPRLPIEKLDSSVLAIFT